MKLIEGQFGKRACNDLSKNLRAVAEAVDRGEIVDLVMTFVEDGNYQFLFATSPGESVVMTAVLHRAAVDKMFKG
jgi:hypothetical protein